MCEQIRAWTENFETFILEVIFEQRKGKRAAFARGFLFFLSKIFEMAVKFRRFLYNVRILRDTTLGVQVIAIGNLTVGGTGKTPVVEKFARELQDQGRHVAILSRGYRSKPPPLSKRLLNKLLFREDRTPPPNCLGWKIPFAGFGNGWGRAVHARLELEGCGRAGGQGPGEERSLCHRKVRVRHVAAGRRVPVLETSRAPERYCADRSAAAVRQ